MATVNNATGVYATLGYNFDDPNGNIPMLSAGALEHLNTMPALVTTWQAQDIRDNNVGGYYQNPVISEITEFRDITLIIMDNSSNANGLGSIVTTSRYLANTANAFIDHTNRLSGVTPFANDVVNPYLDQAIGLGKTALYITNQTDSIKNTAPILGSFTSLMIGPQITANANTFLLFAEEIQAANNNPYTVDQVLILSRVQAINAYMRAANTFLNSRINSDVNYYGNLKNFIDKYNQTKKFTKMGETETYLYMNFIGTDKLKSRIS